MEVEPVGSESDFASLTQWLMANTKDKEVRARRAARFKKLLHARASPRRADRLPWPTLSDVNF